MESQVIWLSRRTTTVSGRLRIVGAGYRDRMPPCMVNRPAGTDDFLFMHFHAPVRVWHDGRQQEYGTNTFFLWEPRKRHTFGNPTRTWSHSWLHCDGATVREAVGSARVPLNQPLVFPDPLLVERNLKAIFDELRANIFPDPTILECRIAIWVRELERESSPKRTATRIPERALQTVRYMETHLAEPIALADLAAHAHLSVSRFSQEFREHLGTSPIDYLLNLRLQQAAHYLRDRNLSVADVAVRVGFNDAFYFSRQFRRRQGCSPLQYRRKVEG